MADLLDFKGPVLVFFLFDKKMAHRGNVFHFFHSFNLVITDERNEKHFPFGANTTKHYPKLSLFEKGDKITFLNR